jgi:peptidoglycan L-alanyl-D-glutamate endopeptidase CwlK
MKDVSLLHPKVQEMTGLFLSKCKAAGYNVIITSTYRNEEEQNALYAQGRTAPGNVVTNARFGDSLHNYKVALDFAPVVNGNIPWNDKKLFMKIADIGVSCGFEAGAYWTSFLDLPHLQYTAGYSLDDFKQGRVDLTKFGVRSNHVDVFLKALSEFQKAEGLQPYPKIGPATTASLKKYGIL